MEKVVCPHCGKIRRRDVFWEGASVVCKCGAVGEYFYGKWSWFKDPTPNKACSRRVQRRGAKVVKSKSKVRVGRTRR